MRALPPLDMHAHVDTGIEAAELSALQAIVFAVTRSLDEAEQALKRADTTTIWGVGCHPGLVGVQRAFDVERFQALAAAAPYVGRDRARWSFTSSYGDAAAYACKCSRRAPAEPTDHIPAQLQGNE